MLGLTRHPPTPDPRTPPKPPLSREPPTAPPAAAPSAPGADGRGPASPALSPGEPATQVPRPSPEAPRPADGAPSARLLVGVNIKLKGVEICDSDLVVVEGDVEAALSSKALDIARPGRVTGTASVDTAEIHGEFTGEITARTRLTVHGTGRVSGTVRYGKLVVAEGGEVNGDVRQIDATARTAESSSAAKAPARGPQASTVPPNDRGQGSERPAPPGT